MSTALLIFVLACYLTGLAGIVYGIFLLAGLAGGSIAGGIALLIVGYFFSRGMNASG